MRNSALAIAPMVSSHAESGSGSTLLITCQMFVNAPDSTRTMSHGLVDSGSSTSFISERLAQSLRLPLSTQHIRISGITGISCGSPLQSVATFSISPLLPSSGRLLISAIVVPKVTCHATSNTFNARWNSSQGPTSCRSQL